MIAVQIGIPNRFLIKSNSINYSNTKICTEEKYGHICVLPKYQQLYLFGEIAFIHEWGFSINDFYDSICNIP